MTVVAGIFTWLPLFSALVSSIALVMTIINVRIYARARGASFTSGDSGDARGLREAGSDSPSAAAGSVRAASASAKPVVSVCIPARNEERHIAAEHSPTKALRLRCLFMMIKAPTRRQRFLLRCV